MLCLTFGWCLWLFSFVDYVVVCCGVVMFNSVDYSGGMVVWVVYLIACLYCSWRLACTWCFSLVCALLGCLFLMSLGLADCASLLPFVWAVCSCL